MITHWSTLIASARWIQRVLLVSLSMLPLLLVASAYVPALLILPFLPSRFCRVQDMVGQLAAWSRTLLVASRDR